MTMPSPFPGMDPYLEGWLWPDVHRRLGVAISSQLAATIDPRYSIRLETSVVTDDEGIGVFYPDVHVHHVGLEPEPPGPGGVATIAPRLRVPAPTSVRVTSVRIRLGRERTLVTSIEVVSPANKYGASFEQFRRKWDTLRRAGVNLVEIDLIRRGRRIFPQAELESAQYLLTVTRPDSPETEAWPVTLREPLPLIPIPLLGSDADAALDLQPLLALCYEEGRYANDIDYAAESMPPPVLSADDGEWVRQLLASGVRSAP